MAKGWEAPVKWLLLLTMMVGWQSGTAAQTVLQRLAFNPQANGGMQVIFDLSGRPSRAPRIFTINNPARIVVDFPNVRNNLRERSRKVNLGPVASVRIHQGGGKTRAAITLNQMVPYKVQRRNDKVILDLRAGSGHASARTAPTVAGPLAKTRQSSGQRSGAWVEKLDFRRGANGSALISVHLSNPSTPVNVSREGQRIVARFGRALLPKRQQKRLDVADFATPVSRVDAVNVKGQAQLTVYASGSFNVESYQEGGRYILEVSPGREKNALKKSYSGDVLSLNFQDIGVRAALKLIAEFAGQNLVMTDSVKGNITLHLENVPWDQALASVLQVKGLDMRRNGRVMFIGPTKELLDNEKAELSSHSSLIDLAPMRTELIQINYAQATEMAKILNRKGGRDNKESLLSSRGTVTVDPRTNSLLIKDVPVKLEEIRSLVTRLDRPIRQVMIDSRIVVASDDFSRELGVRWGYTGVYKNGKDGIATTSGSLRGTDRIVNDAANNLSTSGQPFPVGIPNLADRLGVNLATAGSPAGRIALAILGSDYLVDLELSALQAEGRGEILSNPRVIATDNTQASISQGREIPFQVRDDRGSFSIEFKDAVLELKVTPKITPDDRVLLELEVTKNSQGPDVSAPGGGSQPSIDTQELKTQVLVNNGETVVLGGIFERTLVNTVQKVPLLGDIPLLGKLFQSRVKRDEKDELLIFVTPQIIDQPGTKGSR